MLVKDIGYIFFTGGAGGPTAVKAAGVTVTRTAAGVYRLVLGVAVADNSMICSIDVDGGGAARMASVANLDDLAKQLNVYDGAAAATDTFNARILFQSIAGGGIGGG